MPCDSIGPFYLHDTPSLLLPAVSPPSDQGHLPAIAPLTIPPLMTEQEAWGNALAQPELLQREVLVARALLLSAARKAADASATADATGKRAVGVAAIGCVVNQAHAAQRQGQQQPCAPNAQPSAADVVHQLPPAGTWAVVHPQGQGPAVNVPAAHNSMALAALANGNALLIGKLPSSGALQSARAAAAAASNQSPAGLFHQPAVPGRSDLPQATAAAAQAATAASPAHLHASQPAEVRAPEHLACTAVPYLPAMQNIYSPIANCLHSFVVSHQVMWRGVDLCLLLVFRGPASN